MAKPNGEVSFEAGGKRHTLKYGVNALCELEAELGVAVKDLGAVAASGAMQMRAARALFWAGLLDSCPGITIKDAGAIMSAVGITESVKLATEALVAAFPEMGEGAPSDPQTPAVGTG